MAANVDLTGKYRLDSQRSQMLEKHFQTLDYNEVVCLATKQIDVELEIVHSNGYYTCVQRTQVGHTRRSLRIGLDITETAEDPPKTRQVKIVQHPTYLEINTFFGNGKIRNRMKLISRQLKENSAEVTTFLISEVLLSKLMDAGTAKPDDPTQRVYKTEDVITQRVYKRIGEPGDEVWQEHQRLVDSGQIQEIIRVPPSVLRQRKEKELKRMAKLKGTDHDIENDNDDDDE